MEVYTLQLASGPRGTDDLRPATGHEVAEQHQRRDAADDVHRGLENLSPDDGAHTTTIGVSDGQRPEDEHGRWHHPLPRHHALENERDRDRRGEDTDRISEAAR